MRILIILRPWSIGLDLNRLGFRIRYAREVVPDGLVGSKHVIVSYEFQSRDEKTRVVSLARDFVAFQLRRGRELGMASRDPRPQLKHILSKNSNKLYSPNCFRRIPLSLLQEPVRIVPVQAQPIPAEAVVATLCEEIRGLELLLALTWKGRLIGLTKLLRFANDDHEVRLNLMHRALVPAPEGVGAPGKSSRI